MNLVIFKKEYPFLTIQQYPAGFVKTTCGIVCARSVKLLSSAFNDEEELEEREKWWLEIRNEIRSHMKALSCHAVLGYTETKSICEDVCVLSASGTAALVDEDFLIPNMNGSNEAVQAGKNCKLCHVPYAENELPFPVALSQCKMCGTAQVPDVIFTTVQPLPDIETVGQGIIKIIKIN